MEGSDDNDDHEGGPEDETPKLKLLSTRQRNRGELAARAIEARRDGAQDLGFAARDFVMCGLPYKRSQSSVYERRNGNFVLRVVGDPRVGLPFGEDRLIPIWLATAFQAMGRPDDNVIRFRCATDILRVFGLPLNGTQRARLRERIARVFGATYFVEDTSRGKEGLRAEKYSLIRSVDLWFHHREHLNQYTLWNNVIELDATFAADLRRGSVPIDLDGVRALKANPAALDLYVWEAWRSFRLAASGRRDAEVPLFGDVGLIAQLGSEAKRPRKAKELLKRAHQLVRSVWPDCPNEIIGDVLLVRPALAIRKGGKLSLEGVTDRPPPPGAQPKDADRLQLDRPPPEDNPGDKP